MIVLATVNATTTALESHFLPGNRDARGCRRVHPPVSTAIRSGTMGRLGMFSTPKGLTRSGQCRARRVSPSTAYPRAKAFWARRIARSGRSEERQDTVIDSPGSTAGTRVGRWIAHASDQKEPNDHCGHQSTSILRSVTAPELRV